jgi:hypothetical protein
MGLARPLRLLLPAVLLLGASFAATPAAADVGETIIQRCTHGQSLAGFSPSAYSKALRELSADAEEYTNCSTLIRAAQLAAASGHRAGVLPGVVAPIAATPAEQRALKTAARSGGKPVRIGGDVVRPGVVHATVASALSSLPTPVLAILALLLAGLAAFGGGMLRRRIRGHHPD